MMTFLDAINGQVVKDQPSVGDVHAPSALGNERRKKKPAKVIATGEDTEKALRLDVRKIEDDKQQIFGWASVTTVNGEEVIDKQGDIIPTNEIEKSAYEFVQFSRDMGDMHLQLGTGRMIESVVFTTEKAACGITAKDADGNRIEGWWVGFAVVDPETWKSFKAGERPELSIGGRASWEDA